ncbi:MAG: hypothetical protein C0600_09250 [Ignavibacteria bacterium]|nr:MAG: hypothetical protein C0600_09250 [Ignavibacteria bacterium]
MLEEASYITLYAILTGIAATMTMDLLTGFARRFGFAAGAKGEWVGRWYLGMAEGHFHHRDIIASKEQRGAKVAAMKSRPTSRKPFSPVETACFVFPIPA